MSGNFIETAAKKDSNLVEVGELPSKYLPYKFDKINIRGFLLPEIRLIAKAHAQKDIYYVIKAVDSVIDQDVNILTIPDFYYLLYWLRIESYPKTPMYLPWTCDNDVPLEVNGKKVEGETQKCGFENLSQLTQTALSIDYLDKCPGFDKLPRGLDFPRVSVMPSIDYKEADDPDRLLLEVIKWVAEGEKIDDKIRVLEAQTSMELYEEALRINESMHYGVHEGAKVVCDSCAIERYYRIAINAATFLP